MKTGKLRKGMRLLLDLEVHSMIEKIQISEQETHGLPYKRKKEEIVESCLRIGIREYIKQENLKIAL